MHGKFNRKIKRHFSNKLLPFLLTKNLFKNNSKRCKVEYFMSKTKKKTFEQSLRSLEQIVEDLESEKLPLEESLSKFEDGVKLYRECKEMLGRVEKRITVLTESLKEEKF